MEEVFPGNNPDQGESIGDLVNESAITPTEVNKQIISAISAESRAKVTQSVRHLPAESFEPITPFETSDEFSQWWTSPDRDTSWSQLVPA